MSAHWNLSINGIMQITLRHWLIHVGFVFALIEAHLSEPIAHRHRTWLVLILLRIQLIMTSSVDIHRFWHSIILRQLLRHYSSRHLVLLRRLLHLHHLIINFISLSIHVRILGIFFIFIWQVFAMTILHLLVLLSWSHTERNLHLLRRVLSERRASLLINCTHVIPLAKLLLLV